MGSGFCGVYLGVCGEVKGRCKKDAIRRGARVEDVVRFKPDLDDQLVSFSALRLLVWSSGMYKSSPK